jgi:hypothetical protein
MVFWPGKEEGMYWTLDGPLVTVRLNKHVLRISPAAVTGELFGWAPWVEGVLKEVNPRAREQVLYVREAAFPLSSPAGSSRVAMIGDREDWSRPSEW